MTLIVFSALFLFPAGLSPQSTQPPPGHFERQETGFFSPVCGTILFLKKQHRGPPSQKELIESCCLQNFPNLFADTCHLEAALIFQRLVHHQKDSETDRWHVNHPTNINSYFLDFVACLLKLLQQFRSSSSISNKISLAHKLYLQICSSQAVWVASRVIRHSRRTQFQLCGSSIKKRENGLKRSELSCTA